MCTHGIIIRSIRVLLEHPSASPLVMAYLHMTRPLAAVHHLIDLFIFLSYMNNNSLKSDNICWHGYGTYFYSINKYFVNQNKLMLWMLLYHFSKSKYHHSSTRD